MLPIGYYRPTRLTCHQLFSRLRETYHIVYRITQQYDSPLTHSLTLSQCLPVCVCVCVCHLYRSGEAWLGRHDDDDDVERPPRRGGWVSGGGRWWKWLLDRHTSTHCNKYTPQISSTDDMYCTYWPTDHPCTALQPAAQSTCTKRAQQL